MVQANFIISKNTLVFSYTFVTSGGKHLVVEGDSYSSVQVCALLELTQMHGRSLLCTTAMV